MISDVSAHFPIYLKIATVKLHSDRYSPDFKKIQKCNTRRHINKPEIDYH